ncbi:MAG: hypothetical protein ABIK85_11195 [Candidatus Eisenbacteria bacterium]
MKLILCAFVRVATLIGGAIWSLLLAFFGVLFALWYENIGRPNLIVAVSPTRTNIKWGTLTTRFLSLEVRNAPRRAPLVRRQTATAAHGRVIFMDAAYREVSGPLHIRWDGKAECIKYLVVGDHVEQRFDPSLVRQGRYIDIPPDEGATLAIAFRFDDETEAFGWSNESYAHPGWRNPDFRLPPGEYVARVTLVSGDSVTTQDLRFSNLPDDPAGLEFQVNKPRAG